MHATTRFAAWSALAAAALQAAPAVAQLPAAQRIEDRGSIDRVTVHPQGASVTRTLHRDLARGLWEIRIVDLPEGIDPGQLQARVRTPDGATEGGPRLLGVEYEEVPGTEWAGSKEGIELADRLQDARRRLAHAAQDRDLLAHRAAGIDQVGVRAAANATNDAGSPRSDPAAALAQLSWAHEERRKLLGEERDLAERTEAIAREVAELEAAIAQRGAADRLRRAAVVQVAAPEACSLDMDLTYHLQSAGWAPRYAIRAAGDRSGATIEYDAMLSQRTGEDWKDVRVSLSTATPDRSTEPGEVQPVFVDAERLPGVRVPGRFAKAEAVRAAAGDAAVRESGIAVSFELPRRVSVPSDAERSQRTRIATIEPQARFVHVAAPLQTESVFLRGDLVNASGYQLLPGAAEIHMGGDFVGPSEVAAVAPGSSFQVFFGADRAVRARREVVSRVTGAAGLFGGAEATTWKYRVTVDNGTGRDLRVELLDRRPASRDEKVEVKVADLSAPLSADAEYAAGPQKAGILRWDLAVPAGARGNAALPVTWTVQLTHPKDVRTTPLPD